MRRSLRFAAAVVAVLAVIVPGSASSATPTAPASLEGVPVFGHVFLIIGENTTFSHLKLTNAPYLLGTIQPSSAWLTGYFAATHWSQANYVAMVTGQFTKCQQQDRGIDCHQDVDNLYHQLDVSGRTWKVWLEAGTARCDFGGHHCTSDTPCPLTGFYTTGNPPILFDNIEGPDGVWSPTTPSAECLANDVPAGTNDDPMGTFDAALASGDMPAFNTIIPNGCDDGEANCAPTHDRVTQFDDFLAEQVPLIQASPAFGDDGVIIVTYDEDQRAGGMSKKQGLGAGGHVACAILGPQVVPGSYDTTWYHYSLLRTLEDGFGIPTYLGDANEVSPIDSIWQTA